MQLCPRRTTSTALLFLALVTPSTVPAQSSPPSDRVAGWRSDITWWLDQVRTQHYVYKSKPLPDALVKAAADLSLKVDRYSDDRMVFEMQRLAALVGDGHTYILPVGARVAPGRALPVRFYLFSNGIFIVDAKPGWEQWIGSRLERIGTASDERLVAYLKPAISADNPHMWRWIGPAFLNLRGAIELATDRRIGDSLTVGLRNRANRAVRVSMPLLPLPPMRGVPKLVSPKMVGTAPPLWLRDVTRNYTIEPLPNNVLYVQFNQVMDAPDEPLADFARRLDGEIARTRPQAIVLDVRHNNGGNSYLFPALLEVLVRYDATAPTNHLLVLTGRNTFSAAQNFIAQIDKRTRAVFVGEPSSSKPNFVGEENEVVLPWSGARGSISNRYHENIPGDTRPWIPIDIPVELSSTDYFGGKDPVLDAALEAIRSGRSLP
jgi:hypothetical protein